MNRRKFIAVMQGVGAAPDTEAPTVVISTASAGDDWPVAVTITFSEEVTGFVVGDITAGNCTLANFATADNIVFTVEATPTARAVTLDIDAAVCQDLAGNDNEAATQFTFTSTWFPTDISVGDAAALKALYDSTDGDNWTDNTGWGTEALAANWNGVMISGGKVTQLLLIGNSLTGSIPAEIGNLTNLAQLYLNGNSLTGSIPAAIGSLTNLTQLRLHFNSLSGSIPTAIGNLTNLTQLYLYNNSLSGSIPAEIGNLTNMVTLRLYNNAFSDVESGALQLPKAIAINIDNNGMSQAVVNAALWDVYQTVRTATNGDLSIAGTNAAPSGTFQAAASCPVTGSTPGKEIAHELLNDGCAAGINAWATVTITA